MTTVGASPSHGTRVAKLAYVALFVAVLPLLLTFWARHLELWLPLVRLESLTAGIVIAAAGAGLALHAMAALWIEGHGLPASPFPPRQLVTSGPYRLFAHPIYIGAVAAALGVSVATGSAGGLWVVTPVLACAAAAWVLGFERDLTLRHFGRRVKPAIALAPDSDAAPTTMQRASVCMLVFIPWLVLYISVELLVAPPDARSTFMHWERLLPVLPRTDPIYAVAIPFVLLAPLAARRQSDLRRFALDALWAMVLVFALDLLLPFAVTYHLVWTFIAATAWSARWPKARVVIVSITAALGVSCVLTPMCAAADLAAAGAAFVIVRRRRSIARRLLDLAELIANSWREWTIGPVRLLSHGIYAGVGAGLGVGVATALVGPAKLPGLLLLTTIAIVGAAAWAQLVEGSPQLLRPYGFFGAIVAVVLALAAAALAGVDVWTTTAAFCIGSTLTCAAGRMRCLVQGCCHGSPTSSDFGIVYRNPRSRVLRLSSYGGVPVHATPLYSALWMLLVGAVLVRLWSLSAPLPFIVGSCFILTGLGRFVEEHYRGEPQTLVVGGMRLYQWLAIGLVVLGAAVTSLQGFAAPALAGFRPSVIPALLVVTVATYAAYGLDFPRSNRRFSRLL